MNRKVIPNDYSVYILTKKDRIRYGIAGLFLMAAVSRVFYKSTVLFLVAGPLAALLLPGLMKEKLRKERKNRMSTEFREAIGILCGYLSAGFSVENAFGSSLSQLARLYGEESEITAEFRGIYNGVRINTPVEELLTDFGKRSGIREVKSFAEVFAIARKTGGSLSEIIDRTSAVLREKMAVSEEIENLTASKKLEQRIMYVVPFLLILYLDVSNPGFLDAMYETIAGRIIMTACLLLLLGAALLSRKILDIRV